MKDIEQKIDEKIQSIASDSEIILPKKKIYGLSIALGIISIVLSMFSVISFIAGIILLLLAVFGLVLSRVKKSTYRTKAGFVLCLIGIILISLFTLIHFTSPDPTPEELAERQAQMIAEQTEKEANEQKAADKEKAEQDKNAQDEADKKAAADKKAQEKADKKAKEKAEQEPTFLTTEDYKIAYRELKANVIRAKEKYNGKLFKMTANINGIESGGLLNLFGGATLTMEIKVDNTTVFFLAEFEKEQIDALKKYDTGQDLTFIGEFYSGTFSKCEVL
jgi:energy-coupling factor transporter transmembrane protein EcfT